MRKTSSQIPSPNDAHIIVYAWCRLLNEFFNCFSSSLTLVYLTTSVWAEVGRSCAEFYNSVTA